MRDALERGGKLFPLGTPRTNEPRLVQFVAEPGKLFVSVTMRRGAEQSPRHDWEPQQIEKSDDFGWRSAFQFSEVIALAIATLFAVVSGLATYYFGKHAFGSAADYIGLFLWGAGVDQTKNFIQSLAATSKG